MLWRRIAPDTLMCDPDAPAAAAELKRLRAIDKERERVHNQKLRGMYIYDLTKCCRHSGPSTGWLNRGGLEPEPPTADAVEEVASPATKEAGSAAAT